MFRLVTGRIIDLKNKTRLTFHKGSKEYLSDKKIEGKGKKGSKDDLNHLQSNMKI